jgi:hypothetical protein
MATCGCPRTSRASVGIDQRLHRLVQTTTTYAYQRDRRCYRGVNLNAPVDGVRPEQQFGNIIDVVSDARSHQHEMQFALTVNPGALFPAFNAPLIKWSRATVFANYTWTSVKNNSDGPFATPATGTLTDEWGSAHSKCRSGSTSRSTTSSCAICSRRSTSTRPAATRTRSGPASTRTAI